MDFKVNRNEIRDSELDKSPEIVNLNLPWSLAAVGDALVATRLNQFNHPLDSGFHKMVQAIKEADVAFINLEGLLFRLSEFKGWPEVEHGGYWQVGPPEAAEDLKAMGFNLVNCANNHTTDYGVEGMRLTNELLDSLEMVHSGTGMNLGQASRPGYLDTIKGRIALIGFATSFTPMSRAGQTRPDMMGRPGLNPLRVERTYEAGPALFQTFKSAAPKLGGRVPQDSEDQLRLFGVTINPGAETQVIEKLNVHDEERILHEIRNASMLADHVIVNSHSHEPGNESVVPPPWLVEFAKECLDNGATAFIVHGPHQLRGIEVYRGKPIFYSLGNFIFHEELYDPLPSDFYELYDLPESALQSDLENIRFKDGTIGFPSNPVWYESVIAVTTFDGSKMTDLKLLPIDLGQKLPRSQRGTPRMADRLQGKKIVERVAQLSTPFGTRIVYEDGVGVWQQ
jgi:poly-gamma-glutamate capsule biosynthesis protein CapA/YwtB (metallophosphatase superfamily)